jgi:polyisoprenoid-binding protein YceI
METQTAAKTHWGIDVSHSEIQFKVKHMMITNVTGNFSEFDGSVESDGTNFEKAKIEFKANVASISTNSEQRDNHLKSDDFFSVANYPNLTFTEGILISTGDDTFDLSGNLTIKDVTKSVTLKAELGGIDKDPWGNEKVGFSLSGKINRKDFGLTWNALTESGGMLVSEEIRLIAEIQLVKK